MRYLRLEIHIHETLAVDFRDAIHVFKAPVSIDSSTRIDALYN